MTFDDAKKLMSDRGYDIISINGNHKSFNCRKFIQFIDKEIPEFKVINDLLIDGFISINAQILLKEDGDTVKLSFTNLRLVMDLSTSDFQLTHPDFERWERVLIMYAYQCQNINTEVLQAVDMSFAWEERKKKRELKNK